MSEPPPESTPTPGAAPVHRRRPRYAGKHPRRFAEKYKEHQPERYASDVAKVIASGKTPAGTHRPIMVTEILEALALRPGQVVVDCTLGYGGHARELLPRILPGGRLIGLDVDPLELPRTEARLRAAGFGEDVFTAVRSNFAGLPQALARLGLDGADAILADLGVSSMQLDDPARGFTFKADGPLDLRLNPQRGESAAAWLARVDAPQLARALADFADEPDAPTLARELKISAAAAPWQRTRQLADGLRDIRREQGLPMDKEATDACIRRVFQALRIAVNDEFGALDMLLRHLPGCLRPGGRATVLTFHSGEDRRVKHAFRDGLRGGVYRQISEEVIRPSPEEQRSNPRSSPAKLRWAERAVG